MNYQNTENDGYLTTAEHIYETDPYLACSFDDNTIFFAGDLDCSCIVDFGDIAILAYQWLQPPGVPSADITPPEGDDIVNFLDFASIAQYCLESTEA